ncbi:unnamed protein product, partial [marine sediment metagenome]
SPPFITALSGAGILSTIPFELAKSPHLVPCGLGIGAGGLIITIKPTKGFHPIGSPLSQDFN